MSMKTWEGDINELIGAWDKLCSKVTARLSPVTGFYVLSHNDLDLAFLEKESIHHGSLSIHGYGRAYLNEKEYQRCINIAKVTLMKQLELSENIKADQVHALIGWPSIVT